MPFPIIDDHPRLDTLQGDSLLRLVNSEEVYTMVKSMKPYKALRLDNFQLIFY